MARIVLIRLNCKIMIYDRDSLIATIFADIITIRSVCVDTDINLLTTLNAVFPMMGFITDFYAIGLMTTGAGISAIYTGFCAAIGEVVFGMTNATIAISTATPMIQIVVFPVIAQGMYRNDMFGATAANSLMFGFVDERETTVVMLVGCIDCSCRLNIADRANNLLSTFLNTSGFF